MDRQNLFPKEVWGNMKTRLFNMADDLETLEELSLKNDMSQIIPEEIPVMGIVIEKDDSVIAMGFLRQCEGYVGIMDSVITDPQTKSEDRNQALNILFEEVIKLAGSINIHHLIGFTVHPGMCERSKRFGFSEIKHKILSLEIRG